MPEQLFAIFAFGLVITGIVYLGLMRAREAARRERRAEAADDTGEREGRETSATVSVRGSG
ncbi:MAG: hypothetical protein R3244_06400 [Thermoanaerobaculia bacterium]|nr:hypothetical protein [Thermoanaerobaculia bacterium]